MESDNDGPPALTPEVIDNLFEQSELFVEAIKENQELGRLEECAKYLDKLHENMSFLASLADFYPSEQMTSPRRMTRRTTRGKVNDPRLVEISALPTSMSPAYVAPIQNSCNFLSLLNGVEIPSTILPNQKKKRTRAGRLWSENEKKLFKEGIEKYGVKDLKSISKHVKTRNLTQVRSHMQKYLAKENKEKKTE